MKKKLALMLIPLMLLPLVGFAYAHWSDTVTKKYKLRAGTVEIEIIQWHVDSCTSYDTNCNDVVEGDELKIVPVRDAADQVIGLLIQADPIFPCWELELKMLVHVKGRLTVRFTEPTIVFAGPFETDPCFEPIVDGIEYDHDLDMFPGIPWFEYFYSMYAHNDAAFGPVDDLDTHPDGPPCYNKDHYNLLAAPTEFRYKPCECIMIKQWLHLKQSVEGFPEDVLQEMLECHWLRIDFEIEAENEVGAEWSSWGDTYPTDWVPYEPPPVP